MSVTLHLLPPGSSGVEEVITPQVVIGDGPVARLAAMAESLAVRLMDREAQARAVADELRMLDAQIPGLLRDMAGGHADRELVLVRYGVHLRALADRLERAPA